ncbi:MAG: trypsin-like serine protease [Chromatiaceae bacterium]|nr:trypsin-like serine protease [Chromatiaceae bacterium]MCF7993352.1 trypsin-like serine protease [Chromatiaceae bacterium]MCF8004843.1 trypsin-like serine protease [Chromatiaceae bacterium]MCF8014207.1 trypsin-like serine protease [Chromatiaceae bacterium]
MKPSNIQASLFGLILLMAEVTGVIHVGLFTPGHCEPDQALFNGETQSAGLLAASSVAGGRVPETRIVDGSDAQLGQWPWQVAVLAGNYLCGGSLISPHWIVTAAHCTFDGAGRPFNVSEMRVRAGSLSFRSGGQTREIFQVIRHPQYNPFTFENDIALLSVSQPIVGEYIGTISPLLPSQEPDLAPNGGDSIVIGWGTLRENGLVSDSLQQVTLPLLTSERCRQTVYGDLITENMLCAGFLEGGKDACQGDSGGPLMVADQAGGYRLAGIVSWGTGCARPGYPGVYTRVSRYVDWIEGQTGLDFALTSRRNIYRFQNIQSESHFYTSSSLERDYLTKNFPESYIEEGPVWSEPTDLENDSLVPVYRFRHSITGSWFYTAYREEKENILETLPEWGYEGIAWYAYLTQVSGTIPVHRFWNSLVQAPFYTASEAEKVSILQNYPHFIDQGIAWFSYGVRADNPQ